MRPAWGAATACLLLLSWSLGAAAASGFIRVSGGRFVDDDCNDFVATGLNTWKLLEVAAGKLPSKPVVGPSGRTNVVQWTLATAATNNLTVLRTFGHGTDAAFPLQIKPGKYSEQAFQALDYILDEASKLGVRLILTMVDNWSVADSKSQYVSWSPTARGSLLHTISHGIVGDAGTPDAFFTDTTCRQHFKAHVTTMVNRRNSINGKLYRDDPTIFAWDLMNEPRCDCFPDEIPAPPELVSCRPECAQKMQGWIDEMATHLKEQDPNHLVTVGEEGFWAVGSAYEASNPGNGWAAITGQNFTANHASKAIDFAGIHVWPDNWETYNITFLTTWIKDHAAAAAAMGKPLIVEEFGKQVHLDTPKNKATVMSVRLPFYKKVYEALNEAMVENGNLRGVIFWMWGFEPYVSNSHFGECRHCQAIQVSAADNVFTQIVAPTAASAQAASAALGPQAGCTAVPAGQRAPHTAALAVATQAETNSKPPQSSASPQPLASTPRDASSVLQQPGQASTGAGQSQAQQAQSQALVQSQQEGLAQPDARPVRMGKRRPHNHSHHLQRGSASTRRARVAA